MSAASTVALKSLMAERLGTVHPSAFPSEEFDLYSIPAFDIGKAETLPGRMIGSAKQAVQPDDVLLSRIVPHIRRAWVVGKSSGRRIIASGEWIVFRGSNLYPSYLRHLLVGDPFHTQFMRTVSGVGGSLLRARPAHVAKIQILLPPIAEQRRIADILDRADALRAKRCAAIAQLDALTQSIFADMLRREPNSPMTPLDECLETIIDYRGKSPTKTESGVPLITARVVKSGELLPPTEFIADKDYDSWMRRGIPQDGDVVFTTEAPLGEVARLDGRKLAFAQRLLVLRGKQGLLDNAYLLRTLTMPVVRGQIEARSTGSTVKGIRQSELRKVAIPILSLDLQRAFASRATEVQTLKSVQRRSLTELDSLFASLQHQAFSGQL